MWPRPAEPTPAEPLLSLCSGVQSQAREAEQLIQQEFRRLRDALLTEERVRLSALAAEEEQKIAALQELSRTVEQDTVGLRKLIETVKKEMGDEDVPLLQVGRSSAIFSAQSRRRL